ncbi:MAG: KGG domain-containing protein [Methanothrix sp.]|nr:KGG domain-containing protein [Methanothrix sp.]
MAEKKVPRREGKGTMTVQEAGRKGGEETARTHGREFYEEIGRKGGQKVKELIEEGKKARGLR